MHGHSFQTGSAFTGQNLKFTGHLSGNWLLFAGLALSKTEYFCLGLGSAKI